MNVCLEIRIKARQRQTQKFNDRYCYFKHKHIRNNYSVIRLSIRCFRLLEIVDYLLKPITFDRFFKAIERYLRQNCTPVNIIAIAPETPFIILKSGIKNYKINVADIIYIESIRDFIKVLTTESELTIKYKISTIEIELQHQRFLRVHRSFGPMYRQFVDAALR